MIRDLPTEQFFEGPTARCLVNSGPLLKCLQGFRLDLLRRIEESRLTCLLIQHNVFGLLCLLGAEERMLVATWVMHVANCLLICLWFLIGIERDVILHQQLVCLVRHTLKVGPISITLQLLLPHDVLLAQLHRLDRVRLVRLHS